ncbi:unnamed protein product [Hydatigera taeniaeformis]|uniref:Secreted protein n=1 Tax=Hydatigena taeniaeformis TaxID=6205 RepID=A0A0R3WI53_HYDTA|nr:unnamed protein product [Hydatigera taeniaeformis]
MAAWRLLLPPLPYQPARLPSGTAAAAAVYTGATAAVALWVCACKSLTWYGCLCALLLCNRSTVWCKCGSKTAEEQP